MVQELALQKLAISQGYQNIAAQSQIAERAATLPYTMPSTGEGEILSKSRFVKPAGMPQDLASSIEYLFKSLTSSSSYTIQNYLTQLKNMAETNYPQWKSYIYGLGDWNNKGGLPPSGISYTQ